MIMTQLDPEIVEALQLDPQSVKIHAHGSGSGFASTFKLTGRRADDNQAVEFFVKTATGADAATMFRGEYASLNAVADAVPQFCPRAHAQGPLKNRHGCFLATDFIEMGGSACSGTPGTGLSFASKLAALHRRAVAERGPNGEPFGFPVTTCCGSTAQDNAWTASWADFYAERRLRCVLHAGQHSNGPDRALADTVERTAAVVVPRLLGDGHLQRNGKPVPASVIHGDLWSGNHGRGRIVRPDGQSSGIEEVVFDPACVYGHSEYELGIMRMFGGFGGSFWREYTKEMPKDEPASEWEDRVLLYELYHHLNHYALFGGGYRSGAMSIMQKLLSKYG